MDISNQALDERLHRHPVALDASVIRSDGSELATVVRDLSVEGCCLSGEYRIGEYVEIRIEPIGTFQAQIRWALMGRAGARFLKNTPEQAENSQQPDDPELAGA